MNAALDVLRTRKRETDLDQAEHQFAEGAVEQTIEHREEIRRVRQAVMALPEASRAVLVLKEYEDCSYKEIAEVLEIPIGTVMSRLSYARSVLIKTLAPMAEER